MVVGLRERFIERDINGEREREREARERGSKSGFLTRTGPTGLHSEVHTLIMWLLQRYILNFYLLFLLTAKVGSF